MGKKPYIFIYVWDLKFNNKFDLIYEFNNKFKTSAKEYIDEMERKEAEISRQNDLEIKLKQETAKNTHVVYCPNCGADNIIVGNHGKCKYCRSVLKAK